MGKVGSTSLYKTLKEAMPANSVFHVHFLSKRWLNKAKENTGKERNISKANDVLHHIAEHPGDRIRIITLIREPFERDISDFFENQKNYLERQDIQPYSIGELLGKFYSSGHKYALKWFEREFYSFTGFDVYTRKFSRRRGYSIYHYQNFDILIMKLEKLDTIFQVALKEFLGQDIKSLLKRNISIEKPYASLYQEFKRNCRVEKTWISNLYRSKYVKHFYTRREIKQFEKKWTEPGR